LARYPPWLLINLTPLIKAELFKADFGVCPLPPITLLLARGVCIDLKVGERFFIRFA
jgi:hypothetical protein